MASLTHAEIEQRIVELGPWFHNLSLKGHPTAPDHFLGDYPSFKWRNFEAAIPRDLTGMSVLDIGCNGGFYSLEMKRRGAQRVLGIDHDDGYLAQARFAAEISELDIEFRQLSVYDVPRLQEKFDLVFFMGVFYHLRYPLLALDLLRQHVVKDWFVFQSMLRGSRTLADVARRPPVYGNSHVRPPRLSEDALRRDTPIVEIPTNWWVPNRACAEAVLRSSGFSIHAMPEPEVFICRADENAHLHELPVVFQTR